MGGPQDRRAPRIPIELPVQVVGSKTSEDYVTADISRGGVFIKTDVPKSVRHLLRLKIAFDQKAEPLEVHGMVVHALTPDEAARMGESAGMGIEFIAFGGAPRERWENYVRGLVGSQSSQVFRSGTVPQAEILAGHGQATRVAPQRTSGVYPPAAQQRPSQIQQRPSQIQQGRASGIFPQQQRQAQQFQQQQPQQFQPQPQQQPQQRPSQVQQGRQSPMFPPPQQGQQRPGAESGVRKKIVQTVFPIPVGAVDQLYEIYEHELVGGVMFVCTPERLAVGDRVAIRIIHPINLQEFDLYGKVQQVHTNPSYPGLSVGLRPSTLARREKFRAFIEEGLPEEDLATDVLEE